MTLEPAPLFSDIMHFAPGARALWQKSADGVRIRIAMWRKGPQGSVILLNGRTEYIEKFGMAARALRERGFGFATLDWRCQGLSDPLSDTPGLCHVDDFSEFQLDLEAAKSAFEQSELPRPWFLIAHSMGGAIGLRALSEDRLRFNAAVFLAPLWGLAIPKPLHAAARLISGLAVRTGRSQRFIPGAGPGTHVKAAGFRRNRLTSDRSMFDFMHGQLQIRPELSCGGPSYGWLHAALSECHLLPGLPPPKVPTLVFVGSDERIVSSRSAKAMCRNWTDSELLTISGARHELLMEATSTRDELFDRATALFNRCR